MRSQQRWAAMRQWGASVHVGGSCQPPADTADAVSDAEDDARDDDCADTGGEAERTVA